MASPNDTTQKTSAALPRELVRRLTLVGGAAIIILVVAGIAAYLVFAERQVYIDTAQISAPLIDLSPTAAGRLDALYVQAGDTLPANAPVARVGTDVIRTKVAGLIVHVDDTLGAQVTPGENVVEMIDPTQLRVVGTIDENKGLAQIKVGDPVRFTVDAFGGKTFDGVVDEIAPTANTAGVVFDISNTRPTQQFDVKARFDVTAYPQLKNGMSARMWVYTP
jgi:multidrug resistance efflux pump